MSSIYYIQTLSISYSRMKGNTKMCICASVDPVSDARQLKIVVSDTVAEVYMFTT
jgi:hypothetical protein